MKLNRISLVAASEREASPCWIDLIRVVVWSAIKTLVWDQSQHDQLYFYTREGDSPVYTQQQWWLIVRQRVVLLDSAAWIGR